MGNSTEKKEAYKAEVSYNLARMHDIIMGVTPWNQAGPRKGVIVTDDGIHLDSNFAKEHLKYDELKRNGKVNEITIDSSWPLGDKSVLWSKLVAEAEKIKQGLLVINVCDINLFKHCWDLKQLAKQEKLDFSGYVLLVVKDMEWEKEVKKFVEDLNDDNRIDFKLMMQDFYQLI